MRESWVQFLGREDLLEKEMATHSSTLAWKIPWTEEPGRPQSMGSQRVWHDWATSLFHRLVIAFLPRSKHLLISWLQSPSAVICHRDHLINFCYYLPEKKKMKRTSSILPKSKLIALKYWCDFNSWVSKFHLAKVASFEAMPLGLAPLWISESNQCSEDSTRYPSIFEQE